VPTGNATIAIRVLRLTDAEIRRFWPPAQFSTCGQKLGRLGQLDDHRRRVFLASDASALMTGSSL
jgi:hypothetical protein